jgi:tetratricopeptide (TPR) repeat protein
MRVLSEKAAASGGANFFSLSDELQDEINELEEELSKPRAVDEEEFLSPEEVISEFKKGISRTVAKDDYPTHYNLGIAYKEMGLLDEAIHEFEVASHSAQMSVDCASMIGLCLMGKRDFTAAIDVYRKAIARTTPDSLESLGLSYELAEAFIGNGNLHEAYKHFSRICDLDPTFRDVRRRAKELEADIGSAPATTASKQKSAKKKEAVVEIPGKKNKISYI